MCARQYPTLASFITLCSLLVGCNAGDDAELVGLSVSGLTETRTFAACTEQVLEVTSETSSDPDDDIYTWNVNAPADALLSFQPDADKLRFTARTPGEYTISVTQCPQADTSVSDCFVTEFSVQVVTGLDLNANGVGDACEAYDCTPACEGRSCGLDPICGKSCGSCESGKECNESAGVCQDACVPACEGRTCGLDPVCGKSCGTCGTGETCDEAAGTCKSDCVPACEGRTCGLDPICGTSCGTCSDGASCNDHGTCEAAALPGRVATIVMALTDKRLAFTDPHFKQRARLIESSVLWVSPVEEPNVLVVLDDSCADWSKEAKLIRSTLAKKGIASTFVNEPAQGLQLSDLAGFDVVWFSNPALPVDDERTIASLKAFAHAGGGLVLQGDDITQSSSLQELTRLRNTGNGKHYCGQYIDDDRGSSYKVRFERNDHPITASLSGNTYYYGDDIDSSTLIADANATVLAWASVGCHKRDRMRAAACEKQPVIVAYEMNQ